MKKSLVLVFAMVCYHCFSQNTYPSSGGITLTTDAWHISSDGKPRFYFGNAARTFFGSANGYEFRNSGDLPTLTVADNGSVKIAGTDFYPTEPVLDVARLVYGGRLGTVLARQSEGNTSGDGTFLGVRAYTTGLTNPIYNGKSFSLVHSFYGLQNSAINFYRGGNMTGGFMTFETNDGTEKMRIDPSGKIGIGTIMPYARVNSVTGDGDLSALFSGATTGVRVISYSSGTSMDGVDHTGVGSYQPFSVGGSILGFSIAGTEKARLAASGYFGIGTTNPTQLLSVNGTILAKKVRVSSNTADWPDYVFKPDYKLRPLSEVEIYIKKYSHLPEVTSAAEIGKNGVDLGASQAELLKKVEELTLYIIEQDKKAKQQEERLKLLEKKMNKPASKKK